MNSDPLDQHIMRICTRCDHKEHAHIDSVGPCEKPECKFCIGFTLEECFACVMCSRSFTKDEMDFLGRCIPCFYCYMTMKEDDRPKLSKPFVPIYHGGR